MAKINIVFNNKNFPIDESSFSSAVDELQQHLSTTMSGSGAMINLGGISYDVDLVKLTSATNDFVSYLGKIAGSDSKVVIGGVEYYLDSAKIQGVIDDLESILGNLKNPDDVIDIVVILDAAILDQHVLG